MGEKARSPWVYVGIGCVALAVVVVVAVVGVGWYASRVVKRYADEIRDPVARAAKVKQALGAETLPPGYQPYFAVSVPWVVDMAILSDHAPASGSPSGLGERGFLYVSVIGNSAQDRAELRDYIAGRQRHSAVLTRHQVILDGAEVLGRGQFRQGPASVSYVVQRGELAYSKLSHKGLQTFVLFECPNDQRNRFGIWFLPDPAQKEEAGAPAATATPAAPPDEAALREFLSPFNVCGR